jgi:hypothetical protein
MRVLDFFRLGILIERKNLIDERECVETCELSSAGRASYRLLQRHFSAAAAKGCFGNTWLHARRLVRFGSISDAFPSTARWRNNGNAAVISLSAAGGLGLPGLVA